jgi:hypothetical protein
MRGTLRYLWKAAVFVLASVAVASAQTQPRFEIGPVARVDKVSIEGGVERVVPVLGAAGSIRLTKHWALEGELTQAGPGEFARSYEGVSISYAPPDATRAEIERLGVRQRWRLGYRPGLGGWFGVSGGGQLAGPVDLKVRLGLASRSYEETRDELVLQIPEGIDPARVSGNLFQGSGLSRSQKFSTQRGGLLMGVEMPIRVTRRLSLAPDVRYVYGGPAQIGSKHREVSFGFRAGWGF